MDQSSGSIDTNRLEKLFYKDAATLAPETFKEQVIKDYGKLVSKISYRYYEYYFSNHPYIDLSEVTQQAFYLLLRDILPKYNPEKGPLNYYIIYSLQRALTKYAISENRKNHARFNPDINTVEDVLEQIVSNKILIEQMLAFLEANFSKSTQRILKMFLIEGLSRKEIAIIENISDEAVQLRIAKAKKRIAAWFAEEQ